MSTQQGTNYIRCKDKCVSWQNVPFALAVKKVKRTFCQKDFPQNENALKIFGESFGVLPLMQDMLKENMKEKLWK